MHLVKKVKLRLGTVCVPLVPACTEEAEASGTLGVGVQPDLQKDFFFFF